jgi:hypothetical protein
MNNKKLIHELKKALMTKKFKNAIIILEDNEEKSEFALAGDPVDLISKLVDFAIKSDEFFEITFTAMMAAAKNKGIDIFDKEFVEAIKTVEEMGDFISENQSEKQK